MAGTDWVDVKSGNEYRQDVPFGPLTPTVMGDDNPPPSQVPRSFEYLTASGRDLRPKSTG